MSFKWEQALLISNQKMLKALGQDVSNIEIIEAFYCYFISEFDLMTRIYSNDFTILTYQNCKTATAYFIHMVYNPDSSQIN